MEVSKVISEGGVDGEMRVQAKEVDVDVEEYEL